MHRFAYSLAAISLLACAAAAPRQPPDNPSPPSDSAIRELLARRVDLQKQATGIVVGLTTPAGRRVVSYGSLARGDNRPLNGATVFEIASITKIFTSLLLADMALRGEVALDDPVSKYLPADRVKVPVRDGHEITLFDLANHTSGLPLRPSNLASQSALNKYAGYTVAQLYDFLNGIRLPRDPGSEFEYSNVGYGLLGHALARRAGTSYESLVHDRITGPLGMGDTRITMTPDMSLRLAVGHTEQLQPGIYEGRGALEGAGDLRSTANDLLKLLEAFMGKRPTRLDGAMGLMMLRLTPIDQPSIVIGLGWRRTSDDGHEIIWSNGRADGFRTFIGYSPATRIGVVALANAGTDLGADDIAQHLIDSHYPVNLQVATAHTEIQLSNALLDRYVGRFEFEDRTFISITRDGNRLTGQMTGQDAFEMFAENETGFFLKVVDAQVTFDPAGATHAQSLTLHQGGQEFRALRVAAAKRDLGALVGAWRLVTYVDTPEGGAPVYAFGEKPVGLFIFTADGHISVSIMRNPPDIKTATVDIDPDACIPGWYCTYFGTFDVDYRQGVWVTHVLGGNIPAYLGTDQTRSFALEGDELVISETYLVGHKQVHAKRVLKRD